MNIVQHYRLRKKLLPNDEAHNTTCTFNSQEVKIILKLIEKGVFDNKPMRASTLFLLNLIETEKDKLIKNYEETNQHQHEEFSIADHDTTCILLEYFFTATTWNTTVGPKSGFRITLQFQIEPRKGFKTFTLPEYLLKLVSHDHKDPLLTTLKEFTEYNLYQVSMGKHRKAHLQIIFITRVGLIKKYQIKAN